MFFVMLKEDTNPNQKQKSYNWEYAPKKFDMPTEENKKFTLLEKVSLNWNWNSYIN